MIKLKDLLDEDIRRKLEEGVDDPGILKCCFMAGGPGSGKSFIANDLFGVSTLTKKDKDGKILNSLDLSFSAYGLKVVNSDNAFEKALDKYGIDKKKLASIEKDNPELWDKVMSMRGKAKKLTQKQKNFYEQGRLGMIIDGTGRKLNKIKKQKQHAENLGYDTYMIFVNTSLEVALERNQNRERVLPEDLVKDAWQAVQDNMGAFQGLFGKPNFDIVDNTVYKPIDTRVHKSIQEFIRRPIKNKIGKQWMETARMLKKNRMI